MGQKQSKLKRCGKGLMITGVVLILSAFSLLGYNEYTDSKAGQYASEVLIQMSELMSDGRNTADMLQKLPETSQNGSVWKFDKEIPPMDTIVIDGNEYIGVIAVPSLELELPVMSDYVYENLKTAPNRYSGSIYTNDLVIAGHNYRTHFNPLQNAKIGDEVFFVDVNGNSYPFVVADCEILEPDQKDYMINSDYDLTLFTCTYGGRTRLTVRCLSADIK